MPGEFHVGDLVFAKLRGYPPWPAKITEVTDKAPEQTKYSVLFFGTSQKGICGEKNLFHYEDKKAEYVKRCKSKSFLRAWKELQETAKQNQDVTEEEEEEDEEEEEEKEGEEEEDVNIIDEEIDVTMELEESEFFVINPDCEAVFKPVKCEIQQNDPLSIKEQRVKCVLDTASTIKGESFDSTGPIFQDFADFGESSGYCAITCSAISSTAVVCDDQPLSNADSVESKNDVTRLKRMLVEAEKEAAQQKLRAEQSEKRLEEMRATAATNEQILFRLDTIEKWMKTLDERYNMSPVSSPDISPSVKASTPFEDLTRQVDIGFGYRITGFYKKTLDTTRDRAKWLRTLLVAVFREDAGMYRFYGPRKDKSRLRKFPSSFIQLAECMYSAFLDRLGYNAVAKQVELKHLGAELADRATSIDRRGNRRKRTWTATVEEEAVGPKRPLLDPVTREISRLTRKVLNPVTGHLEEEEDTEDEI